ncbi:DNA cytosine methyltransferase [Pseudonocardia sp.]|uniref:DNA cytosine methyltransferase n=1 Tax=Pseudonocardia sp. TaxID=60912 RepID=UPI003D0C340D
MADHLTATDLFAGAGGSSEGLTQAGIRVAIAANHWQLAVDTHHDNHPDTEHRTANLRETDWRTFPSTDLLWASPSCRKHARASAQKRRTAAEEKAAKDAAAIDRATAFAVVEAAEVHRYPVIFIENVPEFREWVLYPWFLDGLRVLGYTITEAIHDAVDFGLAQARRRLFVAATLAGVELDLTPPVVEPVAAASILDLASTPLRPMTRRLYISDQIDTITEDDVPYLVTYRNHAKARRADQHPLATVTAGGNHHAVAQLIDGVPHQRLLTNRECARAQGFGDHYTFRGTPAEVKRQIGNAVPVGIARWLGERATAALGGHVLEPAA